MHTVDFLRRLFPLAGPDDPRGGDLVRVVVVDRGADGARWPGVDHWWTRAELHALDGPGIEALGLDVAGRDVYFTPHAFTRRGLDVRKADSAAAGDACWVELDDLDVPPETFTPPPTAAVATSEGRFHLYWLLRAPLPLEEVETLNRRLAYGNHLVADRTGWDRTQLLRLPGAVSHKRPAPFPVRVVAWEEGRRYGRDDFHDLPGVPALREAEEIGPLPTGLPDAAELRARYPLTRELADILDRPRKDRSKALWRAYHLCFYQGIPPEHAFALIRGGPNDKFGDCRYNGEADLWRDVVKGYRMTRHPEETPVVATIKHKRTVKAPAFERNRLIAEVILKDLGQHGRFYLDAARRELLLHLGDALIPVDHRETRWATFLNLRYQVGEGDADYRAVNANLYALASETTEEISAKIFSYWDRKEGLLYVSNNNGRVHRLDGARRDEVENGTDGVLFRDLPAAVPFAPVPPGPDAPTLDGAIFGLPNYVDTPGNPHSRAQATLLTRLWAYSLFFPEAMDARPHLVVVGPTDSGKSSLFQALNMLLIGPEANVSSIPYDQKTFETAVSNSHHLFLDNVDTEKGKGWLIDRLAEVATGIQIERHVLYKTNEQATYRVRCALGLTTRDAWFSRADVATRLIPLHVERRELKTNPTALFDRVRDHRGELWHELLEDLNRIVARLRTHKAGTHRLRMAGYADFVEAACPALGVAAPHLLDVIAFGQADTALKHSVVYDTLTDWLARRDQQGELLNDGREVTTATLFQGLRLAADAVGEAKSFDRACPSARSLAQQLAELVPDIRRRLAVEVIKGNRGLRYVFRNPEHVRQAQEGAA